MPNYNPAFAQDNPSRRLPNASEESLGMSCGAADLDLINGLFNKWECEFNSIIEAGGVDQTMARKTTVLESIQNLIASATGVGDTSQFFLTAQAQSRLPIFPEVLSADGRINVSSPASGTVRIPSGVSFNHRGSSSFITTEENYPTDPSTIYHIRWSLSGGFSINDLSDAAYNPNGLAETDVQFDTTYDDMLIARVVTNSSNVASITNLVNLPEIIFEGDTSGIDPDGFEDNVPPSQIVASGADSEIVTMNLSRKPQVFLTDLVDVLVSPDGVEISCGVRGLSRYQVQAYYQRTDAAIGSEGAVIGFSGRA